MLYARLKSRSSLFRYGYREMISVGIIFVYADIHIFASDMKSPIMENDIKIKRRSAREFIGVLYEKYTINERSLVLMENMNSNKKKRNNLQKFM